MKVDETQEKSSISSLTTITFHGAAKHHCTLEDYLFPAHLIIHTKTQATATQTIQIYIQKS
jgi:hypothetical protein